MEGQACKQMPRYKCHKEVWAIKIADFNPDAPNGGIVTPDDNTFLPIAVDQDWCDKFKGTIGGDLGYYVVYEDGYKSWSPSKAFEEGYTLIQ